MSKRNLPAYVDALVLPVLNLLAAAIVTSLVLLVLGESPANALSLMIAGTFGNGENLGYMLYYATNFIFTGLAVSVAYHAGLFNIGGEGQVVLGGVGLSLAAFLFGGLPPLVAVVLSIVGGAVFGALWALIPAWLQAYRGAHVVITTIMFNYIAFNLLNYLLTGPLQRPGGQMPESADFPASVGLPHLPGLGSANLSLVIALLMAFVVWLLLWRTRLGYNIRVVGQNPDAARFAGITVPHVLMIAMAISGALAGMMGLNELLGEQNRLIANFSEGAGFVGIAVAFMGRNHPLGVVMAALLFGFLAQGGVQLGFELDNVSSYLIVLVQGVVILFAGALEHLFRDPLARQHGRDQLEARGGDTAKQGGV